MLLFIVLGLGLLEAKSILAQRNSAGRPDTCSLQGAARLPAFSMDGDYVIGGVFSIHNSMHTVENNYTTAPESPSCSGRLVFETKWILKFSSW